MDMKIRLQVLPNQQFEGIFPNVKSIILTMAGSIWKLSLVLTSRFAVPTGKRLSLTTTVTLILIRAISDHICINTTQPLKSKTTHTSRTTASLWVLWSVQWWSDSPQPVNYWLLPWQCVWSLMAGKWLNTDSTLAAAIYVIIIVCRAKGLIVRLLIGECTIAESIWILFKWYLILDITIPKLIERSQLNPVKSKWTHRALMALTGWIGKELIPIDLWGRLGRGVNIILVHATANWLGFYCISRFQWTRLIIVFCVCLLKSLLFFVS